MSIVELIIAVSLVTFYIDGAERSCRAEVLASAAAYAASSVDHRD